MARVTTGAVAGGEKHGTSYRGGFSDAELADRADDDPSDVVGQLRRRHGLRITQLVQLMFDRIEEAQRPARLSHSGCPSRCGSMRGFVARPDRPDQAPAAEGPAPTGPWKTDRRTLLEWKAFAFASLALEALGRDVFALPLLVRKALAGELRVDDALDEAEERGQLIPGEPSPNEDVERPIGFGCGEHHSRVDLGRICHASLPALRESSELEVRATREVTASFPSAPARARTTSAGTRWMTIGHAYAGTSSMASARSPAMPVSSPGTLAKPLRRSASGIAASCWSMVRARPTSSGDEGCCATTGKRSGSSSAFGGAAGPDPDADPALVSCGDTSA